ncbi:MAG: TonB-dependent receptor, partial [Flavobacteriaceae bacterium]|nr:TonB-dependent receptor [Flavobacteriaceae bacterium]
YKTTGQNSDVADLLVDETYSFFNPKFGASYRIDKTNQLYASFARAHREPNRTDFENGNPRPERLDDIELGWRHASEKIVLNVNGFYMDYTDQLVLTGALDNVGAPIRANSGSSYRLGVEVDASVALSSRFSLQPNIAVSANKNTDFFFQRDGVLQNLGDTDISFSPSIVAGNTISYRPAKGLYLAFLSKYVGEQYMSNIESETSVLEAFFINDLNLTYTLENVSFLEGIDFSLLVNNVFNETYISNGYFYTFDDDFSNPGTITTIEGAGFYPQAGTNFLLGAMFRF